MQVKLARNFFGPDGTLYQVRNNPHDFPDDWDLPKGAEKLSKKDAKEAADNVEGTAADPRLVGSTGYDNDSKPQQTTGKPALTENPPPPVGGKPADGKK